MKKKNILIMTLTVIFIFSITSLAFASSQKSTIAPDTVITQDNIYDVLKYCGLDPSSNIINSDIPATKEATVRDLKNAIKESKKLPKIIKIYDNNPKNVNINNTAPKTVFQAGTATVFYDAQISSSVIMRYSASGAYNSSNQWTAAYGASITSLSDDSVYYYTVGQINRLLNTCYNAATGSAYLQLDYDYIINHYYGIKGVGGILINQTNVIGKTNFNNSYLN